MCHHCTGPGLTVKLTDRDLVTSVFLRLTSVTWFYFEFSLATWDIYLCYITFSGIPSGSKSIKRYPAAYDIIFIHTCVISFLTNLLTVFSQAVNHLCFFSSFGVL